MAAATVGVAAVSGRQYADERKEQLVTMMTRMVRQRFNTSCRALSFSTGR